MAADNILAQEIRVKPDAQEKFLEWQARLHADIAGFPGFVSLEFIAPSNNQPWTIIERFDTPEHAAEWARSPTHQELFHFLEPIMTSFKESLTNETRRDNCVTEVFVTNVAKDMSPRYRDWIAKVHQVEAKFPGFRGVYVQSPSNGQNNWITFLQFDNLENLDRWLNSKERQEILAEADSLMTHLESHRVYTPYGGWFKSVNPSVGIPPAWKQSLLVLLVLFPFVMLELNYLNPQLKSLNLSLATFIGNAISVTWIAWPGMPIAIFFLSWWLNPKSRMLDLLGTLLILVLYAIAIYVFWR